MSFARFRCVPVLASALLAGCVAQQAEAPFIAGAEMDRRGNYTFTSTGQAVAVDETPGELARSRLAAQILAKKGIVEKIRGEVLRGRTEIENLALREQQITSVVEGWVYGVNTVDVDTEGKVCTVTVSLSLPANKIAELQKQAATPVTPARTNGAP